MVRIIEHSIERHFSAVPKPQPYSEELPKEPLCMYGWKSVIQSLAIPEHIIEEFCTSSISEFACFSLNGHLLQMLPQCTSMSQESRICSKLVTWCITVKPPYVTVWGVGVGVRDCGGGRTWLCGECAYVTVWGVGVSESRCVCVYRPGWQYDPGAYIVSVKPGSQWRWSLHSVSKAWFTIWRWSLHSVSKAWFTMMLELT